MSLDLEMNLKIVWVLNRISGVGYRKFLALQEKLGDLSQFLDRDLREQLVAELGLGANFLLEFETLLASGDFEREREACLERGIVVIGIGDPAYPHNLLSIYDPPLVLYLKGDLIPEDEIAVAIVGTRHPSLYGSRIANRFGRELAARGVTVVSGLARGIDGEAHRGALLAQGRTIAVLGSGLDVVYPKQHATLFDQIAEKGALVSEYPLGTEPATFHFPRRNRIINGLSRGVLVVEASERSGSLITASLASDEGREVYVIPGEIDSITSRGTNRLIQRGAKMVVCAEDILEDLSPQIRASLVECRSQQEELFPVQESKTGHLPRAAGQLPVLSEIQRQLLKLLADRPLYFDEVVNNLGEKPGDVRLGLTQLELEGIVKVEWGGRYRLNRPVTIS